MKLIAAVDKNWAIGYKDKLLVHIPEDMKRFREITMGKVVVLGRKTLAGFPNGLPLAGRTNIILSTREDFTAKNAIIAHSMDELFEMFDKKLEEEGLITHKGTIIDATFVDAPRQRNSRDENKKIKNGEIPEEWKSLKMLIN